MKLLSIVLVLSAAMASAQPAPDARPLQPAIPIERELAPGAPHTYLLALTEGQYAHVVIDQRGIDVVTTVVAPSGQPISTVDSANREGPESIWIVADADGDFRLAVSAANRRAAPGRYEIRVADLRRADAADRVRVAALKRLMEADALLARGTSESLHEAITAYEAVLDDWRALRETVSEQDTLTGLGDAYRSLGDNRRARGYYSEALASFRATGNRRRESITLVSLGQIDNNFGEYQSALDHFSQALALFRASGARGSEATTLASIGLVYSRLGQPAKALEFYSQALPVYRDLGNQNGEAIALHGLGQIHTTLGEYRKALDFYTQALPMFRTAGNRRREAQVLASLGWVHGAIGDHDRARASLDEALSLSRVAGERGVEAQTLHSLGAVNEAAGDHARAVEYYRQALALRQILADPAGQASSLAGLARLARAAGHLDEARTQIEAAIARIESLRTAVARQELRSSYLASKQVEYEFYVDLLMQMHVRDPAGGHEVAALEAADRARARTLLDMLAEARADIRKDAGPELLERERVLQGELNAKESARLQLLSGRHTDAEAAAIQKEVEALLAAYQEIQSRIRAASPRYAALTQPRPLQANDIRSFLDDDTMLLEYALGDDRSFLWIVTSDALRSFELPGRAEIEEPARRLHQLLSRGPQRVIQTQIKLAAAELSRIVLTPIAHELHRRRLLVVTAGVLQYVPFAMLPDPSSRQETQPLIVAHEIAYLPSASMLKLLDEEHRAGRTEGKGIAVLADPVFDRADPRAPRASAAGRANAGRPNAGRSAAETGVMRFDRLIYSRREARAIEALAAPGQVLKALDFAANRVTATSTRLGEYGIVHFATHTLINSAHPELSGIVLSLVDERGQAQDGFVRVHEIYNLRLAADLVVLSGCRTALGQEIRGEGLIGLTRGFMYAGVPRVVASLWNVKDAATAELMQRFYRGLLQKRLTPAAALRAAQVSMWRDARWSAPHQWAAFVLQGLPTPMSGQ